MKKIIEKGTPIYQWDNGRFSYRYTAKNGKRSEKMLKAVTFSAAVLEYDKLKKNGMGDIRVGELAQKYLAAGCPDSRGVPRGKRFIGNEQRHVDIILPFFERYRAKDIKAKTCLDYKTWRIGRIRRGTGETTIDRELTTLSNILSYGVLIEVIEINYIHHDRPRFRLSADIRHCRQCSPRSGDELHALCNQMVVHKAYRSESLAWQALIEAMTGCRTKEVLALRVDAGAHGEPGWVEQGKWLHVQREKGGDNPFVVITPELQTCLSAFFTWHKAAFPRSKWWFPSWKNGGSHPVDKEALTHALQRASGALWGTDKDGRPMRPITSHGLRAFFVEWRRSIGESDAQIAGHLGHRSGGARLIWEVYGKKPANWHGGAELSPVPVFVKPFWAPWLSTASSTKPKEASETQCEPYFDASI